MPSFEIQRNYPSKMTPPISVLRNVSDAYIVLSSWILIGIPLSIALVPSLQSHTNTSSCTLVSTKIPNHYALPEIWNDNALNHCAVLLDCSFHHHWLYCSTSLRYNPVHNQALHPCSPLIRPTGVRWPLHFIEHRVVPMPRPQKRHYMLLNHLYRMSTTWCLPVKQLVQTSAFWTTAVHSRSFNQLLPTL